MNQNLLKNFRNVCPEFSGPGELCQFEPQDNEIGKVINLNLFPFTQKISNQYL